MSLIFDCAWCSLLYSFFCQSKRVQIYKKTWFKFNIQLISSQIYGIFYNLLIDFLFFSSFVAISSAHILYISFSFYVFVVFVSSFQLDGWNWRRESYIRRTFRFISWVSENYTDYCAGWRLPFRRCHCFDQMKKLVSKSFLVTKVDTKRLI